MSRDSIAQTTLTSKRRQNALVGNDPHFVPIALAVGAYVRVMAEIRVDTTQLRGLVLWAERTEDNPSKPRLPADVFPAPEEAGLRYIGYKLHEKGILERTREGYILTDVAREHARRWRDQVLGKAER